MVKASIESIAGYSGLKSEGFFVGKYQMGIGRERLVVFT
jgi:hypothetical protein